MHFTISLAVDGLKGSTVAQGTFDAAGEFRVSEGGVPVELTDSFYRHACEYRGPGIYFAKAGNVSYQIDFSY